MDAHYKGAGVGVSYGSVVLVTKLESETNQNKSLPDPFVSETHFLLGVYYTFPGRSCLQFLIACSTKKQRGKAWEIALCQRDRVHSN